MSDNIRPLNSRIIPVASIVSSLEKALKEAKSGEIRAIALAIVEGNGDTAWQHAADLDSQEELRLLKLLLHPIGELELDVRERIRESCTEEKSEDYE